LPDVLAQLLAGVWGFILPETFFLNNHNYIIKTP